MVAVLLLFLSAGFVQLISAAVPVVIWGSEKSLNYSAPPLMKLSSDDFSEVVKEIVADRLHNVAVFVQDSFSMEDLRRTDLDSESAYPNLAKTLSESGSSKYFSYVEDPVASLKSLSNSGFQISNFDDGKTPGSPKNLFIFKLNEPDNDYNRLKLLRTHDNLIHETCNKIKAIYNDAVCVLTGLRSSWVEPNVISSRKLLQAVDSSSQYPPNFFKAKNYALFYTKQPLLLEDVKAKEFFNVTFVDVDQTTGSTTKQVVTINTPANIVSLNTTSKTQRISVKFYFTLSEYSYAWQLTNVSVTLPSVSTKSYVMNTTTKIIGSYNFSYHSPTPIKFGCPEYNLTFYSMQVELFNGQDLDSFSTAEDTVGFFTIPIWSGLFVTSLLVTIVLVGLSLIFDIKTMDQFDDPKGKTVTINASE